MSNSMEPAERSPAQALERMQGVTQRLSDAARRARMSVRARGAFGDTGARARRGARAMRVFVLLSFLLVVALPTAAAAIYFIFLASDQYVSEAKFTVSSGAIPRFDAFGSVTGVPSMLIVQDTLVVTNYVSSRALVDDLEKQVDLRSIYSSKEIDFWARFDRSKPIEKFVDYWEKMASATAQAPSGIITLTVRAFSPRDAQRVAEAVIARCEELINGLNERMLRDTVATAEEERKRAAELVSRSLVALKQARDREGVVDVNVTNRAASEVLAALQTELLKAEQEYAAQRRYVAESAPQLRGLRTRIQAMKDQIAEMRASLTAQDKPFPDANDQTMSGKMTLFANLELEKQIAEKRYATAVAAVEGAKAISERKMLYLHQSVMPGLPEEARYPRRWLSVGLAFMFAFVAWLTLVGVAAFGRNHMA